MNKHLRLVHDNCNSFFYDILGISNEKTIHQKDSADFPKEVYKFVKRLFPPKMNDFPSLRETPYNLQSLYSTVTKLSNLEPKLLNTEDHRYETLF